MNKILPILILASVVFLSGCIFTPGQTTINQSQNVDKCSGLNESQCKFVAGCKPLTKPMCGVAGDCYDFYEKCEIEANCIPFNPLDDPCEMLFSGAYVSSVTGVCEFYDGNACSRMPFKDLAKCQSDCQDPDPATLCDGVVCGEGESCLEGGCIPTGSVTSQQDDESCSEFSHDECPSGCVVGPSCPVCEDIGCHVEGYNKDW